MICRESKGLFLSSPAQDTMAAVLSSKGLMLLLVIASLSRVVQPLEEVGDKQWTNFKKRHSRLYSQKEDQKRRGHFSANLKMIQDHNAQFDRGLQTYRLTINKFADMSFEEFSKTYLMENEIFDNSDVEEANHSDVKNPPKFLDWRRKGIVTRVKTQKHCGSCWAFSATGALESQHALKTGKLVSLSEQNLIDCSTAQHNNGCHGGLANHAFQYVIKNKGIANEKAYPYKAKQGKCRFEKSMVGATCRDFKKLPKRDEIALQKAVAKVGPIAIAIHVYKTMAFYRDGVYDDKNCPKGNNHAVLLVGYGRQKGTDYWLVKNSWGKNWGHRGYIKMARNKNNQCNIASFSHYPIV